jgi:hypothetical protein
MSNPNTTNTQASKKSSTPGDQNPSLTFTKEEMRKFALSQAAVAAGSGLSAAEEDDKMTAEKTAAMMRSRQASRRQPSGPSTGSK